VTSLSSLLSESQLHSSYFYSAFLSPLLLRGAPATERILCRSFTMMRHRQLQVKDLPSLSLTKIKLGQRALFAVIKSKMILQ